MASGMDTRKGHDLGQENYARSILELTIPSSSDLPKRVHTNLLFTIAATWAFSTGLSCKAPPGLKSSFNTNPAFSFALLPSIVFTTSSTTSDILSSEKVSTCPAYSSRTAISASCFCFKSSRFASANSWDAAFDADNFLRRIDRTCMLVLIGEEVLEALPASAMTERRTLSLYEDQGRCCVGNPTLAVTDDRT